MPVKKSIFSAPKIIPWKALFSLILPICLDRVLLCYKVLLCSSADFDVFSFSAITQYVRTLSLYPTSRNLSPDACQSPPSSEFLGLPSLYCPTMHMFVLGNADCNAAVLTCLDVGMAKCSCRWLNHFLDLWTIRSISVGFSLEVLFWLVYFRLYTLLGLFVVVKRSGVELFLVLFKLVVFRLLGARFCCRFWRFHNGYGWFNLHKLFCDYTWRVPWLFFWEVA